MNLEYRVVSIVAGVCRPGRAVDLALDTSLSSDLHFDAIDLMCLVTDLDEAFGLEIPDADVHGWQVVADVLATVSRMLVDKLGEVA